MSSIYVKFKDYIIEIKVHGNALIVADSIVLDARSVTLPKESQVYYAEPKVKQRVVYAFYNELKGVERPPYVDMLAGERRVFGSFELRAVDMDFERYLTVVTPGSFLYEYAIITPKKLALVTSAKRDFYLEDTGRRKIIHIV